MEWLVQRLLDLLLALLPYAFAFLVIYVFRKRIADVLIPRVQSVKVGTFEITFLKETIQKIAAQRLHSQPLSDADAASPLLRARNIAAVLHGARLLWIDDQPESNVAEVKLLGALGITVDTAITSAEARQMLSQFSYNGIISDIQRGGSLTEGITFLASLRETRLFRYTIFYVNNIDATRPLPPGAFAITNRPDQLLHLLMDLLERERWSHVALTHQPTV